MRAGTSPGPDPVTFVVSHLEPMYGIERSAADLVAPLSRVRPVEVLVVRGDAPDRLGEARVTRLHLQARGLRRLTLVRRLRGAGAGPGVTVLVGAWVAVPWLLANLGHRGARRVVVWEHSFTRRRAGRGGELRRLWSVARVLYRRARLVVVPGPAAREFVSGQVPASVLAIPNVVVDDAGVGSPHAVRSADVVVVGRLEPVKRVDLALRAFALSRRAGTLTVAGDGAQRAGLEALAARLGIGDRVRFVGSVPREQVLALMRTSGALLHTAAEETFGLVYLEAAAAGLPVVATANLAARDVIPAAVPGLVAGDDPTDVARALDDALARDRSGWPWDAGRQVRRERFDAAGAVRRWHDALELAR